MKRKAVWITWSDAADIGAAEWLESVPADVTAIVNTVGILVRKTKTHYVITHSLQDESPRGVFSIPKACVLSIRELEAI